MPAQREARRGQDAPARHDHRPGDDRIHRRSLQRKELQPGGDQARDDRTLPGRVLHHLQAGQAREARYRSHPLLQVHPPQVEGVISVLRLSRKKSTPEKKTAFLRSESLTYGNESRLKVKRCHWKSLLKGPSFYLRKSPLSCEKACNGPFGFLLFPGPEMPWVPLRAH